MRVDTLSKSSHHPCQHICSKGCAIYDSKPKECDVWECAWKSGWIDGDERRRPDTLGVMLEFRTLGGRAFLWAFEVWKGAFEREQAKYVLGRLSKQNDLVMTKFGSMEVTAEFPIMEFLRTHGVGTLDVPLLPSTPFVDENGVVVAYQIAKQTRGGEFEITIRPAQAL